MFLAVFISGHLSADPVTTYTTGLSENTSIRLATVTAKQRKTLTLSEPLIQDFGSCHNTPFASCMATGERCALSPAKSTGVSHGTCYQGSISYYYVEAHGIEDSQCSLRFANTYKVKIPGTITRAATLLQSRLQSGTCILLSL